MDPEEQRLNALAERIEDVDVHDLEILKAFLLEIKQNSGRTLWDDYIEHYVLRNQIILICNTLLEKIDARSLSYIYMRELFINWIEYQRMLLEIWPYSEYEMVDTSSDMTETIYLLCRKLEQVSRCGEAIFTNSQSLYNESIRPRPIRRQNIDFILSPEHVQQHSRIFQQSSSAVYSVIYMGQRFALKCKLLTSLTCYGTIKRVVRDHGFNDPLQHILYHLDIPPPKDLVQECTAIASFVARNKQIIECFAWYPVDTAYITVMEYVPGVDLQSVLDRTSHFNPREVIHIAAQIFLAIEYLHYSGFIHSSISPQSILLTSNMEVKLGGFHSVIQCRPHALRGQGSEIFFRNTAEELKERPLRYLQTYVQAYKAPEFCDENRRYGRSIDFWSYGVLICKMYTGRTPFGNYRNPRDVHNVVLPFQMDDEMKRFVEGLLKKYPSERLGSYTCREGTGNVIHGWQAYRSIKYHCVFRRIYLRDFSRTENLTVKHTQLEVIDESLEYEDIWHTVWSNNVKKNGTTYISHRFSKFCESPIRFDFTIIPLGYEEIIMRSVLKVETHDDVLQALNIESENRNRALYNISLDLYNNEYSRMNTSIVTAQNRKIYKIVQSLDESCRPLKRNMLLQDIFFEKEERKPLSVRLRRVAVRFGYYLGLKKKEHDRRIYVLRLNPYRIFCTHYDALQTLFVSYYKIVVYGESEIAVKWCSITGHKSDGNIDVCLIHKISKNLKYHPKETGLFVGDVIVKIDNIDVCVMGEQLTMEYLRNNMKVGCSLQMCIAPISVLRNKPLQKELLNFIPMP